MNELIAFPKAFRPSIGYNYSLNGQNLIRTQVAGGMSRATVNFCQNKVIFNLSFVIKTAELMQVWHDWYWNVSEQGTRKFSMLLNATGSFEDHVCLIVPGSITVTGSKPANISMQIEVEKIFAPFKGELYGIAESGYTGLTGYFDRIEQFANFDLK